MWLLKLHFAISILCFLTVFGFNIVYKDTLISHGYIDPIRKIKWKIIDFWVFITPILNIGLVIVLLMMIVMDKEELERWCENHGGKKQK